MYIELDFGTSQPIDRVRIEGRTEYYDRTVKLEALDQNGKWNTIAEEGRLTNAPVTVGYRRAAMAELKARGIHFILATSDDIGADDLARREILAVAFR